MTIDNATRISQEMGLTDGEKLELGLNLMNSMERPTNDQLRILIFTATYFVLDGVTLTIRRLESHLRSTGAVVKVLSTIPDDIPIEQTRDVIVVPGIKIPQIAGYAMGIGLDENTLRLIEDFNPNIIHFTVPDFVGLDGIRYCQRNNIAYIATWHSNYSDYLKYYYLEWILGAGLDRYLSGFFEQVPVIYVPTPFMLNKLNEKGYGESTQLKEWGRGIDMKLFSPERRSESFRASKGFSPTDVVVLWVGRLVPEKRPDIWLNIVKRLQMEGYPVKAMVVGNGQYEKTLSQLNSVVCCGWLSGLALAEAYASCDILLFPSDVETFGNVTLEALASGCVAIVEQNCSGHLVKHGLNGCTSPTGDLEDFYMNTKKLVLETETRLEMSRQAREFAYKFDRNVILQQMAENYKDAIVNHRDPMFIKSFMSSSPYAVGRNFLSILCCNYWAVKHCFEPFLITSSGVTNIINGSSECVTNSRTNFNCDYLEDRETLSSSSRYEDERKGRSVSSSAGTYCVKVIHYSVIALSYVIFFLFAIAAFTVKN